MDLINENDTLILCIDIQDKLLNVAYNKNVLKNKALIMINASKILSLPMIISEQYPKGLGSTINEIKEIYTNNENYIEKTSFSALNTKEIFEKIKEYNKKQILIFGIETHICVMQTAIELINAGYEVFLIKDASGSRNELEHVAGIERIKSAGGNIITTEIALFELLRSSKHIKFKEIQSLIK